MQQYASAFHFLSASINLRPSRGQTLMLITLDQSKGFNWSPDPSEGFNQSPDHHRPDLHADGGGSVPPGRPRERNCGLWAGSDNDSDDHDNDNDSDDHDDDNVYD